MPLTKNKPKTYSNASWTMAIASRHSALSHWWGQTLEQISGFTLEFNPKDVETENAEGTEEAEGAQSNRQADRQSVVVQGNQTQLESLAQLTERHIQSLLVRSPVDISADTGPRAKITTTTEDDLAFPDDAPEWQADTAYGHSLYLGSLQVEPIISELNITTTQLYDLSEILQASLAAVQPKPGFTRELPVRSPAWSKTAAAAAVAVGITGGLAWFIIGSPTVQTASEPEDDLISLNNPPQDRSQGPDGVDLPPDFQAQPTPPAAQKPGTQPPVNTPSSPISKPPIPTITLPNRSPSQRDQDLATANQSAKQVSPQTEQGPTPPSKKSPESTPAPASNRTKTQTAKSESEGTEKSASSPAEAQVDKPTPAPPDIVAEADSAETSPQQQILAEQPPSPKPSTRVAPSAQAPAGLSSASDFTRQRSATASGPSSEAVLTFFQSQWQGQDALQQSLSYTIEVQPNGIVSTVIPKNDLASAQIEQTPIPPAGAFLIPPFGGQNSARFEVTLYPDGTVSVKSLSRS